MIAQKNRFRGHNSVSRVRGSVVRGTHFSVFYSYKRTKKDKTLEDFRMAIVVSKKTAKSAVVRNRIRRRLYEAVRVSEGLHNLAVDTVFVVHDAGLATVEHEVLKQQVSSACKKIAVGTDK